ncbi:hypothetical protein E1287_40365 [Actinomadura sp. KC06]|uniref:hypothetical protein n=1 Tax=Actinomadura sp. KC06 TaxID=2530369 RepID=UPI001043FE7F|nr:hypothetical protein [Actinomadura sp. KC06]TDD21757.1 hypothetical protein E1287_40365 [Actinomadura sp. KC06]
MSGTERTLTFSDNLTPAVGPGTYTITVGHVLPDGFPLDGEPLPAAISQEFQVTGLRLHLGDGEVHGAYPVPGSNSPVHQLLPHIALERRVLPWETRLAWTADAQVNKRRPWMALLLFTKDEIVDDPEAAGLTTHGPAGDLLVTATGLTLPAFSPELTDEEKAQDVHTIRISKDVFGKVAPTPAEIELLTHVRGPLPGTDEDQRRAAEYAFVTANRVPSPDGGAYVAHLVSLEGHTDHFASPEKLTSDIRLLSLYSWTFTCQAEGHAGFSDLREGLIKPGQPTQNGQRTDNSRKLLLRMRQPATAETDDYTKDVQYRLDNGYVPLAHDSGTAGDFAWYRGPLVPYEATQENQDGYGAVDVSYAVARTLGRCLVLADQAMSAVLASYLDAAQTTFAGVCSVIAPLLDADTVAAGEHEPLRDGLSTLLNRAGDSWRDALDRVLAGEPVHRHAATLSREAPAPLAAPGGGGADGPADPIAVLRAADLGSAATAPPMTALMNVLMTTDELLGPVATATLGTTPPEPGGGPPAAESAQDSLRVDPTIAAWLDRLRRLEQVPFDHLVPNAAMLPPESLRFFRVDPAWIDALLDGAFQAARRSTIDEKPLAALRETYFGRPFAAPVSGVLIRSQLISAYPKTQVMVSKAQADGSADAPGTVIRHDRLAPDVLLCLFDGLPRDVVLHEPMQGLHVGVEKRGEQPDDDWVGLRTLVKVESEHLAAGQALPDTWAKVPYRQEEGPGAYVLDIDAGADGLAARIWSALDSRYRPPDASALSPAHLALQMVQSPEKATLSIFTAP